MWKGPIAVLALAACSRAPEPASPAAVEPRDASIASNTDAVPTRPVAASEGAPRARVRWANIVTVEGCFYFSGPFNGRDELLRGEATVDVNGERVRLQLGAATFDGTLRDDVIEAVRVTKREHEGMWTVTETIRGTYDGGALRATYRYEECGPGEPTCPGRCTMTADLSMR